MLNKGFVIIAAVIILILLTALGIFCISMFSSGTSISKDAMSADEAFYIAEAGLQYAMAKLATDSTFRNNPTTTKNFGSGSFTVSAIKDDTTYTLTSTATIGEISRVISQSVLVFEGMPKAFEYGAYANSDNITITDIADLTVNGDLASSGTIDIAAYLIDGVNGDIEQNTTLPMVIVDYSYFQSIADNVIDGDKTFTNGTFNGVWYVDGNVEVEWGVTINGTIVATGNILINDATTINITPDPDKPALVAAQNITAESLSALNITGLVFAEQNVTFQGMAETNITGAVIAGQNISSSSIGSFNLTWDINLLGGLAGFTDEEGESETAAVMPQKDWKEQ